jgi:hypothetical protein
MAQFVLNNRSAFHSLQLLVGGTLKPAALTKIGLYGYTTTPGGNKVDSSGLVSFLRGEILMTSMAMAQNAPGFLQIKNQNLSNTKQYYPGGNLYTVPAWTFNDNSMKSLENAVSAFNKGVEPGCNNKARLSTVRRGIIKAGQLVRLYNASPYPWLPIHLDKRNAGPFMNTFHESLVRVVMLHRATIRDQACSKLIAEFADIMAVIQSMASGNWKLGHPEEEMRSALWAGYAYGEAAGKAVEESVSDVDDSDEDEEMNEEQMQAEDSQELQREKLVKDIGKLYAIAKSWGIKQSGKGGKKTQVSAGVYDRVSGLARVSDLLIDVMRTLTYT